MQSVFFLFYVIMNNFIFITDITKLIRSTRDILDLGLSAFGTFLSTFPLSFIHVTNEHV